MTQIKWDPIKNLDRLDEFLALKRSVRIAVCPKGDLFHEDVPTSLIDQALEAIHSCKQHTFMVLTKRPENIQAKLYGITDDNPVRYLGDGDYLENLWLGVTAENQARADERIPILFQTPAAVRFVSCEPLLGPIDLTQAMYGPNPRGMNCFGFTDGCGYEAYLQWIIAGGETGPGARPVHPDWVRNLRDQCQVGPTPFHFKSWGEWRPELPDAPDAIADGEMTCPVCGCTDSRACEGGCCWIVDADSRDRCSRCAGIKSHEWPDGSFSYRVGPKAAGRLFDGREWDEYPEVDQ